MTFLSLGVPGILVALLLVLTVRNPQRRRREASEHSAELGALQFARAHRRLLTLLVLAVVLWGFNGYGFLNWYPAMLHRSFGMTPQIIARTYGVAFLIGGVLGALALAPLTSFVARRGRGVDAVFLVSIAALSVLALSSVVTPLMTSRGAVIAWCFLSVFCQSLSVASVYSIIALVAPSPIRGAYTGFYMSIMNITGGAFGAVLVGMLADHVVGTAHLNWALSIVGILFGPVSTVLMWLAAREYRQVIAGRDAARG
jgi:MFS family permease